MATQALDMDLADMKQNEKIKALVKTLDEDGVLKKVDCKDDNRKAVQRYQLDEDEYAALWECETELA